MLIRSGALVAVLAGTGALLWPAEAQALGLGRARGPVLVGRPLQVSIPLTLEESEDTPCFHAELFQADQRTGEVDVRLERAADGIQRLRLSSPTLVEEPVVTLYLRVGCAGSPQVTRGFVLLAEHVPDQPAAAVPASVSPRVGLPPGGDPWAQAAGRTEAAAAGPRPPGAAVQGGVAGSSPPAGAGRRMPAAAQARPPATEGMPALRSERAMRLPAAAPAPQQAPAAPQQAAATPQQRPAARADAPPAGSGTPRLRLDPVDLDVEMAPALKLAPQLREPVRAATPQEKASAAATWKALAAPPELVARQALGAAAADTELRTLHEVMLRQADGLAQLTAQLQKAESERTLLSVVLAVLAAVFGLGLGFVLWLRSREAAQQRSWWQQHPATARAAARETHEEARIAEARAPRRPAPEAPDVDSDWRSMSSADGDADAALSPAARASINLHAARSGMVSAASPLAEFAESQAAGARLPKAEELLDMQQKAEFFLTIGQPDKALQLLEGRIRDHMGSSPLVWLDLLDLCHRLGRREDYERIRGEFHQEFNARLPTFDANRPSGGLADHPRALSRITLLWDSPRVLQVIEDSLFEHPNSPSAIPFDLEAARDLLLLYSIARDRVQEDEEADEGLQLGRPATHHPAVPDSQLTPSQLAAVTAPVPLAQLDDSLLPAPEPVVAPDIDLTRWDSPPSGEDALPPITTEQFDFPFETRRRPAVEH